MNTNKKIEENKNNEGLLSCDAKSSFVGDVQTQEAEQFPLSQTAEDEKQTLAFWDRNEIFQKSIDERKGEKEFTFYDGPPFATGMPHYGHLLAGTIKDVIPRYKTMQGFKVARNWGWDCHGLPIENMIEKEIDLNSKAEIEQYGIDTFNAKCKDSVLRYDQEWKKIVPKAGRWVNMDKPYKTMDADYTESLWWAFSQLNKKDLVSKAFKPMHICPRCETTLSNNEVTDGYKDIKDLSVTAKFELVDESGTFVLAWTTTPWTLPGNVALAVGNEVQYVKTKNSENNEQYIFAKELFEKVQKEAGYDLEIVEEFSGAELVGKAYAPLFDYYSKNGNLENRENGWKIYSAEFVTTEAGTGIVHIAPAFGEDDLQLGQENNLPWVQHVEMNGAFAEEVTDFAGKLVRKKDFHEESDIEIIKHLAHAGKLFFKEKYEHSYPHCWRCDTPLLNYATSSWFINAPKIKDQLVAENKKISWVPEHIGTKRFHNWLESTRDWAVSRSRYWGAPLPVWENKETGDYKVLGSLEELKEKTRSTNKYTFMRHGQSQSNVDGMISSTVGQYGDKLTIAGKEQVEKAKESLQDIDVIFVSPFERTQQTADIISKEMIVDERLGEIQAGDMNGRLWSDVDREKFVESRADVKKRVMDFLYEVDKKYTDKHILIVAHGIVGSCLREVADSDEVNENAVPYVFDFAPIPHNEHYELDFHRPFIDQISFVEDGKKYEHVKEVFDCWFESGSMPFASKHYPFENTDIFNPEKGIGYPADFIAEGQDQTRGWFNTMLILSTALFGKASYKNVIVNGMVLAEDGKKMSKSLKNYPDVRHILHTYGADALRIYLMSSAVVRGGSLSFSEKRVDEIMKKVVMKTKNILAFYDLYKSEVVDERKAIDSKNILDRWMLEKTRVLVKEVTAGMEKYELDEAAKPFVDFVDDFSTWYVRRSRDRYKGDNQQDKEFALATTKEVLKTFAQTIAPIAPFVAEHVWQALRSEDEVTSVHLSDWPTSKKTLTDTFLKNDILETMDSAREIVSVGMESRAIAGLKVRQPLESVLVIGANKKIDEQYIEIITDELNIKNIIFEDSVSSAQNKNYTDFSEQLETISSEDGKSIVVVLNKNISPQLQEEGNFREFLRQVQILRKKSGLQVQDMIELKIDVPENSRAFIDNYRDELEKAAGVKNINFAGISDAENIRINDVEIKMLLVQQ